MAHIEVQEQYPTAGRIGPAANDSPEPGIPLSRYQDFVRSIASLQDAHHFLAIHYFLRCEFCTDSSSVSSNKALRKRHWRRPFRPLASFDRVRSEQLVTPTSLQCSAITGIPLSRSSCQFLFLVPTKPESFRHRCSCIFGNTSLRPSLASDRPSACT